MTTEVSHFFPIKLFSQKDPCVPLKVIPQTKESYISNICGPSGLIDSMDHLTLRMSLDTKVRTPDLEDFVDTKNVIGDN